MKIGIDIRASQLGSAGRGIGKYVFDLVEGVTRLGPEHEYVLFTLPGRPLPARLTPLPARCRAVPVRTPLYRGFPWEQPVRYAWRLKYLLDQRRQEPALARAAARAGLDVLHQPCPVDDSYFPGGRAACRSVVTFHDATPEVFAPQYIDLWPPAQQYVYRRQMAACRRADAVVAISESAGRDAVRYAGVAPEKIRVVYNSVSEEFVPVSDGARLSECFGRLGVRPPYFLFCSAPDPAKNVPRIVEAFACFQRDWPERHQLVMITKKTEYVLASAFEAGLVRDQVLFTGFVSDVDLVTLYSGAVALVSPSLHEGFGLPAAQAMGAGTPVIASDRSSQPEVVGDAGLLVDPEDAGAIAGAMRRLAGDAGLRAGLSARGRERAGRFGWRRQAQAMLDVYAGGKAQALRP